MTKQTLVTITDTDNRFEARVTVQPEGGQAFERIVDVNRLRVYLTNLSGTQAAVGFQVTVRDLRTF